MKTKQKVIPVFMAVDNNYIPFLGVALKSLIDNSSLIINKNFVSCSFHSLLRYLS